MKIIYGSKEKGVRVPKPFEREITLLLGPDKGDVKETRINLVTVPPGGKTNYHGHDRPEALFVIDGKGSCKYEQGEIELEKDMLIWAEKDDPHQISNDSDTELKLLTFFIPGFATEKALYRNQLKDTDEKK